MIEQQVMIITLFLFALLPGCLGVLIAYLFDKYGYIFPKIWHKVRANVLPKKFGVRRLCIVTGAVLAATTFLELPNSFRLEDTITETETQTPNWIVFIIAFCIPFIVAKVIEFIIEGFRRK